MQLGIMGLGRMGANIARRLIRGGHECVVFDMSPNAVAALVEEKATGAAETLRSLWLRWKDRAIWLMVPAGVVDETIGRIAPLLEPGDILIDGMAREEMPAGEGRGDYVYSDLRRRSRPHPGRG